MKLTQLVSLCGVWTLVASSVYSQTIIEPKQGEVEFAKLQATDGSDGDLVVERVVRNFQVGAPPNQEIWIPLGHFEWGELHKLTISAAGNSAQSNAEVTFSTAFGAAPGATSIRTLNQYNAQGRFRLYWRSSRDTGFGKGIRVFMKYNNVNTGTNIIRVEHQGTRYESWQEDGITSEDIAEGIEMKANIELQTGQSDYPDYNLIRGTYLNDDVTVNGSLNLNGEPVLSSSSLETLTPKGIGINGSVPSNGIRIVKGATIGSRNLENGALIIQDNNVGKLSIDANELVTSHGMHFTVLEQKHDFRFLVQEAPSHREVMAEFLVSSSHRRGVLIANGTGFNGQMAPAIVGFSDMPGRSAMQVQGTVLPAADVEGKAVIDLLARTHSNESNPMNSNIGPLTKSDILQVRNLGEEAAMVVSNKGQTKLTNTAWKADPEQDFTGDTDNNNGEALLVEGHTNLQGNIEIANKLTAHQGAEITGNTNIQGNLEITGNLTMTQAQGDISMGIFGE